MLTAIIWALFLSPKSVLATDRFDQSLIELLLIGGAVAAQLELSVLWVIPVVFGVSAAVVGFLATAKRLALGAWRLALGAWRLALGAWRLVRSLQRLTICRLTARREI